MRPGVNVQTTAFAPTGDASGSTGTAFMTGISERGPLWPVELLSMADFQKVFGDYQSWAPAYDYVDVAFRQGVRRVLFSRVVGTAPTVATKTVVDRAGTPLNTLAIDAIGPGAAYSRVGYTIANGVGANSFTISTYFDSVIKETSPDLFSPSDAVAWAQSSMWIRVRDLASATAAPNNNPAVVASITTLVGGGDDRATIADTHRETARARFGRALGPGQLLDPGVASSTNNANMLAHAKANNRYALMDAPADQTAAALLAAVANARDTEGYGQYLGTWFDVPGRTANTKRVVPLSPLLAGLMSQVSASGNDNQAAAGRRGVLTYPLAVRGPGGTGTYSDADYQALNDAGVTMARSVYGTLKVYGARTTAPLANTQAPVTQPWLLATNARLRMQIQAEALLLGEDYPFEQIDGRKQKIAEWGGALAGMLKRYWDMNALYGETAEEAFGVDVGPAVNPDTEIANGHISAVLRVKFSPFAEQVDINVVKYAITEDIPA